MAKAAGDWTFFPVTSHRPARTAARTFQHLAGFVGAQIVPDGHGERPCPSTLWIRYWLRVCPTKGATRHPKSVLSVRVSEIVEVNRDAVAVDPGRANAEAVEGAADGLVPWREVENACLLIQAHSHPAVAARAFRIVTQKPVVDLSIGINTRRPGAIRPERVRCLTVRAVHRIEKKPFTRRSLDVDPEIILRYGLLLRRIALQAVLRVVKANRRRAVADRAQDGDFSARLELGLERRGPGRVSERGHAGRPAAVAAKTQPPQFPRHFA